MLLYKKGTPPVPIARFNIPEVLDWKNGKLIFEKYQPSKMLLQNCKADIT